MKSHFELQPNENALFQLIGRPNPVLVWIGYETRVAFSKDPPKDDSFFLLPGSPKLYGKGVVFGCRHDGTLCDVPTSVSEALRRVRWGRTARAEVSAARRQEARRGL